MARCENLPNANQHREEEEEGDIEAGGTPGPIDGAGQGQGAAGEAVDVETSGAGLAYGNVPGNTSGDSAVPSERRVTFSRGVSTPPGRERQTTGHMSPVELARRRDGDEGSAQLGAMRGGFHIPCLSLA